MKNRILLLVIIVLLVQTGLILASAQTIENDIREKVEGLEKAKENIERNITNINETTNFLTKQWIEILEKTTAGKFLIKVGKVLDTLSPIFVLFIGIKYSLSWLFFLSLIAAAVIFIFIYKPVKDFFDINPIFASIISLVMLGLISIKKIIPETLKSMSFLIPNKLGIIISIIITIGITYTYWILIGKFGKEFREQQKKEKEKEREMREEALDKLKDTQLRKGV